MNLTLQIRKSDDFKGIQSPKPGKANEPSHGLSAPFLGNL